MKVSNEKLQKVMRVYAEYSAQTSQVPSQIVTYRDYAADLLEARELIKETRRYLTSIMTNGSGTWMISDALALLKKSKDYA